MIDAKLLDDVRTAEGCKLESYRDTEGWWTIGYGHYLGREGCAGVVWTQERADAQLVSDLELAHSYAMALPEWVFLDTPCRQNALTELYFNMGSRWLGFTNTRAAIRTQRWQTAHDQLLNSLWAVEVGVVRSTRLANYLLKGVYP